MAKLESAVCHKQAVIPTVELIKCYRDLINLAETAAVKRLLGGLINLLYS